MNSTFLINATRHLRPDHAAPYRELASRIVNLARGSLGCCFFDIARDVLDPATFRLIEGWASSEARAAWFGSEKFQEILAKMLQTRVMERHAEKILVSSIEKLAMPSA